MIEADAIAPGGAALAELRAYLRVGGTQEDPMAARLLGTAAELCEQFTGEVVLARSFRETLSVSGAWTRLARRPVRAIASVEGLVGGAAVPLGPAAYSIDLDAAGAGWVRVTAPGEATRIRVTYACGLAADWAGVPEALRQGMLRLAAHLYTHRSGEADPGPPAAVTALWRPYRRLRIG